MVHLSYCPLALPGPFLSLLLCMLMQALDELGVPWGIALNLTFPETVTPHNIER